MKFDFMGIIFMIIAIAIGQFLSGYLAEYLGSLSAGIAGTLITGVIVYLIYTLITHGKIGVMNAVIFSVLIYISNLIAAYVGEMIGLSGSMLSLVVAGFIAALLWGWIGGKSAGKRLKI